MPLSDLEHRLIREIEHRRGALLDDLRLHVGLPTGRDNHPALDETRDRFAARLAALGAPREDVPGEARPDWIQPAAGPPAAEMSGSGAGAGLPVAVFRRARPGLPRILISGHLDTVHDPLGDFRELSIAPDGKTATGPGCVDMKGGLVIALHALEALEALGVETAWSVILNSDEETGSFCSDRALRAEAARHDIGLALEPAMADGGLVVARGGSGQFLIECFGKAAHVGRDFASGVSAVSALARAVLVAGELSDSSRGVCVNIGPLEGGSATNVVADHARAWGNARFPSPEEGARLEASLTQRLAGIGGDASRADGLPRVVLRTSFNRPAKPLTPGTERLARAARAVAEDLGQLLPFGSTGGVCDGNNLQAAGLPTIDTLGVRGGGLHTLQEWIELASLVDRCQMLAILMARLSHASG